MPIILLESKYNKQKQLKAKRDFLNILITISELKEQINKTRE